MADEKTLSVSNSCKKLIISMWYRENPIKKKKESVLYVLYPV